MPTSNQKLIGWARLVGFLGFLLGVGFAVYEANTLPVTVGDFVPAVMLMIGGAVLFIGGAHLPKLLKQ